MYIQHFYWTIRELVVAPTLTPAAIRHFSLLPPSTIFSKPCHDGWMPGCYMHESSTRWFWYLSPLYIRCFKDSTRSRLDRSHEKTVAVKIIFFSTFIRSIYYLFMYLSLSFSLSLSLYPSIFVSHSLFHSHFSFSSIPITDSRALSFTLSISLSLSLSLSLCFSLSLCLYQSVYLSIHLPHLSSSSSAFLPSPRYPIR